jgi:hypothetical protein
MTYNEMKKINGELLDAFPMTWAFSAEQLKEAKKKLGVTEDGELLHIGGGGLIKKLDASAFVEMMAKLTANRVAVCANDQTLTEAIVYELGNHEYNYTGDPSDALDALGVDPADERVKRCLADAIKQVVRYE